MKSHVTPLVYFLLSGFCCKETFLRDEYLQQLPIIPTSPMQENRDNKPWEGQLYLCHSSAIVCKLLYKKFFRKTDTTVIYGQWKQVLLQQQRIYDANGKETLQGDEDESLDMYVIYTLVCCYCLLFVVYHTSYILYICRFLIVFISF